MTALKSHVISTCSPTSEAREVLAAGFWVNRRNVRLHLALHLKNRRTDKGAGLGSVLGGSGPTLAADRLMWLLLA